MKLSRLRVQNFRCYKDEFDIDVGNLTVIVGKNDIGKSALLEALSIFFDEMKMESDDGCVFGNKKDVRITCEFIDLPQELIIDSTFPTSLEAEYLLNSGKRLEIVKVFDTDFKTPKLTGIFAKAMHPSAQKLDDLLLLKNEDLKKRAADLAIDLSDIDQKVNTQLRQKIWGSQKNLDIQSREIPLDVETGKKVWDQLKIYLPSFALFKSDRSSTDQDIEAQDPMKIAVKEALKAKEDELAKIAKYVETEVESIAHATLEKLQEMDTTLASELNPVFSPPNWSAVFKINLTSENAIPLNKRGSGVRRLVLLNFFRAKVELSASEKASSSVIYAIEEPETSQHPSNQILLLNALQELTEYPERQVLITTHSPSLGRLVPTQDLRFINCDETGCRKLFPGDEQTLKLISNTLGVLPDNNVKIFIGVEGKHDIRYLKNISKILHKFDPEVIDLENLEDKGQIIFIPLGGDNLVLWISRLEGLNIPEFYLFDRDQQPPEESKHQKTVDQINNRGRCKAVLTKKKEIENYIHPDAIKKVKPEIIIRHGDYEDIPMLVAKEAHGKSGSPLRWEEISDREKKQKSSKAKVWLNDQASAAMTHDLLDEIDPDQDVISWLKAIKEIIEG